MYKPYKRNFSFTDTPSSIFAEALVGGLGTLICALCVFGAIALVMGCL